MNMIFLAVLGLSLLGSFVACYFCSKTWHWAQVLLGETVFLLSLAFLILAGEVFRIQGVYGPKNVKNLAQIEKLEPLVNALQFGTEDQRIINTLENQDVPVRMAEGSLDEDGELDEAARMLSVRELDHRLGMVTRARGRMWRDASIASVNPDSLTLTVPAPDPHGIKTGAIIYAFEQGAPAALGQRGPIYIGEFRVTGSGPQQVQIQPASELDERQIQKLAKTQPPWILYENMPLDQYPDGQLQILAGTTPAELQKLIPQQSLEEYVRHGSPAEADDDEWHRVGYDEEGKVLDPSNWGAAVKFVYQRSLRDYNLLFQEYSKRYTQMEADYNALTADNKQLEKTLASAKKLQSAHEQRQQALNGDLAGVTRDRTAMEAHSTQVTTQLGNAQALLSDVVKQNAELAKSVD